MLDTKTQIEQYSIYKLKGYSIDSIIELAYRFGCIDPANNIKEQKKSIELVKKTLLGFDSFKDLNSK